MKNSPFPKTLVTRASSDAPMPQLVRSALSAFFKLFSGKNYIVEGLAIGNLYYSRGVITENLAIEPDCRYATFDRHRM